MSSNTGGTLAESDRGPARRPMRSDPLIADELQLPEVFLVEPLRALVGAQAGGEMLGLVFDLLARLPHVDPGGVEVVLGARDAQRLLPGVLAHEVGEAAVEHPHVIVR